MSLASASSWLMLVIVVIALMGFRGGSYTAPAYPAAAILGVALLYRALHSRAGRWTPAAVAMIALVSVGAIGAREQWGSRGATTSLR